MPESAPEATESREVYPHTPLFVAQHADRYARQELIRQYEGVTGARLIVMIDQVFEYGVTLIEELVMGASPTQPMHLMLSSPGGDGEVAVRLVRSMQSRCSTLTIIVPDMAKSAATIMCLGADELLMGPAADLGPVDPQLQVNDGLVGARDIEQAVSSAEERVQAAPEAFPLYASLLADVNMLMVEQARSAKARSYDLIGEALACSGRSSRGRSKLIEKLKASLVDDAVVHGATLGPSQAKKLGLPVKEADLNSEEWKLIWSLWTKYFHLGAWPAGRDGFYEGRLASQHLRRGDR